MRGWNRDHTFFIEECYQCKVEFGLSPSTYEAAQHAREKLNFYCPYGHAQHYVTGESEADKLRRERDRAIQRNAEMADELASVRSQRDVAERRASAAKGQVTRLKNRASAGTCPCCNRHFSQLERHMAHKHPDYKDEPVRLPHDNEGNSD